MVAVPAFTIDGSTKIMGVIGDPIAQVMTPTSINPIFQRLGAPIVCVPMHIHADRLAEAWAGLKSIASVVGFGITLPHKQAALTLCDSLDPLAAHVSAVNMVRREADGSFRGYQFDGKGFVRGLVREGHDLSGRDCLMIGAGGAANAIAFALAEEGVRSLTIANRTASKAEQLAAAVNDSAGRNVARTGDAVPVPHQVVINATSLGLSPDDPLPIDPATIDATMLIAEVVAKPEITELLARAGDKGAGIHSGIHMIRGQVDLIAAHIAEVWGKG